MTLRRAVTVTALALLALVGLSAAALATLRLVHEGEILPGVVVDGIDVGGLSQQAAVDALRPVAEGRERDPVTLTYEDQEFTLEPGDAGYEVDLEATVAAAFDAGRDGGVVRRSLNHVESFWNERDVALVTHTDEAKLAAWIANVATKVDADPSPGSVSADPTTLRVSSTPPTDGHEVDRDATQSLLRARLADDGPDTAKLPVAVVPQRVSDAAVEEVAKQARRALEAPLTLHAADASVTLEPAQLAPMVGLKEESTGDDQWTVRLDVSIDAVEQAFADTAGTFDVAPVPARFDVGREPPRTLDDKGTVTWEPVPVEIPVVPSQDGRTFDAELASAQLSQLLAAGTRDATLELKDVSPEFTTEDAEAFHLDHLLSTFTTYHSCCQARVVNIHRLADMVDGTLVAPGEQFSINQISGERTCSKGFRPAGMILAGEIVDVCGGGVSQFGTTTYNAAFFAGLPLDAYKAHSFYISRYPMGREATLNYPSPDIDVKFTNTTGNGLLVKTAYSGTSITVSIYGHSDVAAVTSVTGNPYNTRPYPTEYRENKALAPGAQRVVQSGKNGFNVHVARKIEYADGHTEEEDYTTVYVPEHKIVERNSSPPPPPPPPPSPKPSPPPGGKASPKPSGGSEGGN